jgi:DHA1 family multidrug resistance protein-like MFS transporter
MFDGIKSIRYLDKNLLAFLLSLTFTSIAAINLSKYLERFIIDMEYGASGVGQFVFVTGIVGILTTAFIVPQVFKLKKDITVMVFINIASAIIITIVFRMSNIMLALYTLYMGYMMLKAVYAPLETNFISSHSKDGEYGKIMGVRQFFFAIGFVIGPVVANVLYKIKPIYVFDMSVIMFMMAFVIILVVRKNINKEIGLEIK